MADEVITREVLTITHTNVTDTDRELGAMFNQRVLAKSIQWMEFYLDHGPPDARLAVVKACIPVAAKLSSLESKDQLSHTREQLLSLTTRMSVLDPGVIEAEVVEVE